MKTDYPEIKILLQRIYGLEKGGIAYRRMLPLLSRADIAKKETEDIFSEKDIILICYGDSIKSSNEPPIRTMHRFAKSYFRDVFSAIHFLPFFPYSSDDGFSVTDYAAVRPELGTWQDIEAVQDDFKLMFDLVLNHISAKSKWFHKYLQGEQEFDRLAIEADPSEDLSRVVRPRSLPLLTKFKRASLGDVHLWTTFSDDQIDLNFKSLDVLFLMIGVLMDYIRKGASILRLDAIAYLWKELGTSCIHLPQTHDMVKLFRAVLDVIAPHVLLMTETNVPHKENISYFGNGEDEAQMVYNFTLPPLLLHAFLKESAAELSAWAATLALPSEWNAFFNFTASHDGIGVRPLEGIIPSDEVEALAERITQNGGRISYKRNSDGSESPYELNITYVDAMAAGGTTPDAYHVERFLASQAIQYVLPGVPGTYIHSILGSRNWEEGVRMTSRARTINRESLQMDDLITQIKDPGTFRARIFFPYIHMIKVRRMQRAFHPKADFQVHDIHPRVFALSRMRADQRIYTLTNISSRSVTVSISEKNATKILKDLISGKKFHSDKITLKPYEYAWLVSPSI